ncbi:MAG: choice-of-anchor X domain-containing protein [Phycisphaerae bacterium]
MKSFSWRAACALAACALATMLATAQVRISQVYGGGGVSAGGYNADYVELYNAGAVNVSLVGMSVQVAGSATTSFAASGQVNLTSGSIAPNSYFLIRLESGTSTTGSPLPTPDFQASPVVTSLSSSTGKVALVSDQVLLVGTGCPIGATVLDLVSYTTSTTATGCFEGAVGNAVTTSGGLFCVRRKCGGGTDNNDNRNDFENVAPSPRNSASPPNGGGGLAATATATPATGVSWGGTSVLTLAIVPCSGTISGAVATVNLSSIGGGSSVSLLDNGVPPDAVAGDNIFSANATVANGTLPGTKSLAWTYSDGQGRSGSGSFSLGTTVPPPPNDLCANAIPVVCGSSTQGYIDGGTDDFPASPVLNCGNSNDPADYQDRIGVWYSFIGDGNPVRVSTCNTFTSFDTQVIAFDGACGALNCVAGNDDATTTNCPTSGTRSIINFTTVNGTTYYIMVQPFSTTLATGVFQLDIICSLPLQITCNAQSGAPTFTRPLSATVIPGTNPLSTGIAVSCDASLIGGGTVTMLDNGVAPDAVAGDGIYTGNVVVGAVATGAYSLPTTATDAQARTATCNIAFTVTAPPPANDDCANAIPVNCDSSTAGAIDGATIDFVTGGTILPCANTPDQAEYNDRRGVWYTLTGNGNAITVSTCDAGTNFDTQIVVFDGVCGALNCIAGNDDAGSSCSLSTLRSIVPFNSVNGTTYHVLVCPWGTATTTGSFVLNVICTVPLGVTCSAPVPASLPSGATTVLKATVSPGTNPNSTGIAVSVDASSIGAGTVTLLDDGNPPDATAGDNIFSGNATVSASPGAYSLPTTATDAQARTATCNMSITVTPPPPANDECANAVTIPCGGSASTDNSSATTNASDPAFACRVGGSGQGAGSVWFKFVASGSDATLDTNLSTTITDTLLAVYDGSCGSLVQIGCDDDAGTGLLSLVNVTGLTAGNTYYVEAAAWSTTSTRGNIVVSLTCPEPLGACCLGSVSTPPMPPRTCTPLGATACAAAGGRFQGVGSFCTPGVSCCPGDVDGDFDVDESDLGILLANWQLAVVPGTSGDLDGDGLVAEGDLGILLSTWQCVVP